MTLFPNQNEHLVDTPAVVLFPQIIQQNIKAAIQLAGGASKLRPHVKTHKLSEITLMLMEAGVTKFKCATVSEAEMLALCGADDVLLAYQPSLTKSIRLHQLVQQYPATKFSCLIDNAGTAETLADTFQDSALSIYIDINVGMNRTGVAPQKSIEVVSACKRFNNLHVRGVHCYDGHVHATNVTQRRQEAAAVWEQAQIALKGVTKIFPQATAIVIGGSPTFHFYAGEPSTEVSPGTFVFWDEGYAATLPDLPFQPAAFLMTRVVSILDDHLLCLDLGHKSVASENPFPRIKFLGVDAVEVAHSEEHLVVETPDTSIHTVGAVWYGVPLHICPTVALYEKVWVAENRTISGEWKVHRDRMLQI